VDKAVTFVDLDRRRFSRAQASRMGQDTGAVMQYGST